MFTILKAPMSVRPHRTIDDTSTRQTNGAQNMGRKLVNRKSLTLAVIVPLAAAWAVSAAPAASAGSTASIASLPSINSVGPVSGKCSPASAKIKVTFSKEAKPLKGWVLATVSLSHLTNANEMWMVDIQNDQNSSDPGDWNATQTSTSGKLTYEINVRPSDKSDFYDVTASGPGADNCTIPTVTTP